MLVRFTPCMCSRPAQAADPLRVLKEVSQNFPGLAEPLSRLAVDEDLRTEVAANGRVVQVRPFARLDT